MGRKTHVPPDDLPDRSPYLTNPLFRVADDRVSMWVEILCGLILFKILRRFLHGDDALPDIDSSDSDASFAVAARLEKLYGGKAFVGLRIPDADSGVRQHIDVVLVTKRSVLDRSLCHGKNNSKTNSSFLLLLKYWIWILLTRTGEITGIYDVREVMVVAVRNFSGFVEIGGNESWVCTSDKKHKPQSRPDPVTHPFCCYRDANAGRSRLEVLYFPRDYRGEGASSSDCKEIAVKPSTEVLFQQLNSKKAKKFKLSSIVSVTLSG
ncbi:hypothetical protein B296_00016665 [Ensete ventricosum]|uniref:Uncharacterized protein n=1 Tax=Ensete ventricosum TaxID=4639 RepID=A0A426ZVP6_ENSVE|nr:hypothetical protein B296_00016665 [Ensete ventricosum]